MATAHSKIDKIHNDAFAPTEICLVRKLSATFWVDALTTGFLFSALEAIIKILIQTLLIKINFASL